MFPIVVGLNYKTAPVEIRERVSVHHSQMVSCLQKLRIYPGIEGVVLLSTCNRFEIYAVSTDVDKGIDSIKNFLMELAKDKSGQINKYFYTYTLYPAVKHLFRVVSGLDSMVLGESQILGQVAKAYELSCTAEVTNKVINVTFQKALAVGKKVRTETYIDQFSTSISYTAVELAKQKTGSFQGKKILILGTGEMSVLTMKHLVAQGASTVIVSNRSFERAKEFAAQCQGHAVPFADLNYCLEEADLIFSATASKDFIITAELLKQAMKNREQDSLLLIDIAVPRDIDPEVKDIQGVSLYDIDDLRGVVDSHQSAREVAAIEAEKIISKEMDLFKSWHNSLSVLPTIAALQQRGEEIKNTLLDQTMPKLEGLSPKQEKAIRSLANSIVKNFLHNPITTLKKVSNTPHGHLYTEIIQTSFALDVNEERAE
ncbi:MAG: glutamyl-tRNA reductase [Gracilibacter sp. BRH_c7a]|nr:MAG: glutamyl-tRNA reductase [Gracilibacter sp. BRH_c7a]